MYYMIDFLKVLKLIYLNRGIEQRATDFDEVKNCRCWNTTKCKPFFSCINDRQGKQMFSGLGKHTTIDDKTKKDFTFIKRLFNFVIK